MMTTDNTQFYLQQYQSNQELLPGSHLPWFKNLREEGMAYLAEHGFPTRHDEDWKYTPLTLFEKVRFSLYYPSLDFSLVQTQGQIYGLQQLQEELPAGAIVTDLATAAQQHPQLLQQYLSKSKPECEHAFIALNTAFMQNGLFIYLPKHTKLAQPLIIQYHNVTDQHMQHLRNVIIADEGSQLMVTEQFHGENNVTYFTSSVTEIFIANHAEVIHTKLQYEGDHSFHVGKLFVTQDKESQFESHSFSFGGMWVRSDTDVTFTSSGSSCLLNGLYMAGGEQHIDHHTDIQHLTPENKSQEYYKGILKDHARAVFNGKVYVAKHAQHTDSAQYNKNILLSRTAQVNTKPQLEIFADDVKCAHGATVGQLEEDSLFYLRTRGLTATEAKQLLINAFADDIVMKVHDPNLKTQLYQNILTYLG